MEKEKIKDGRERRKLPLKKKSMKNRGREVKKP